MDILWWPWVNHLSSAMGRKPLIFLIKVLWDLMMNSTIWDLENDDNNCNKSLGWTCHWGILGISQLGSEYQILTLSDLNTSLQAVNEWCICSAPFVWPVCQLSGASCRVADCCNLFQMLPVSVCLYLGQITSGKGVIKTRIKQLSSHPVSSAGNLRVREAEFLLAVVVCL